MRCSSKVKNTSLSMFNDPGKVPDCFSHQGLRTMTPACLSKEYVSGIAVKVCMGKAVLEDHVAIKDAG